jgi:rubrerythrin
MEFIKKLCATILTWYCSKCTYKSSGKRAPDKCPKCGGDIVIDSDEEV